MISHFPFSDTSGPLGAAFANGCRWAEQRKFLLGALKDVGAGNTAIEASIVDNVQKIVRSLEETAGRPTSPKMTNVIFSSLFQIMFGKAISIEDPQLEAIQENFFRFMGMTSQGWYRTLLMVPFGVRICQALGLPLVAGFVAPELEIIDKNVAEHLDTFQEDNLRDLTDHYIKRMKVAEASHNGGDNSFRGKEGLANLRAVMLDLFGP